MQASLVHVGAVNVRDLELAAWRRREGAGDLDHLLVIEVESWNRVV